MISRVILFLLITFVGYVNLNSEEVYKKYFNLPFCGGLPRFISKTDNANFKKNYAYYKIDLFADYAQVHCLFKIENKGEKAQIVFAYPVLGCKYSETRNKDGKSQRIDNNYKKNYYNFTTKINNQKVSYITKADNLVEMSIAYKYGTTHSVNKRNIRMDQYPNSYVYYYNWNTMNISLKRKEKKTITIDYTVPLYYNKITSNQNGGKKYKDKLLSYNYNNNSDSQNYISEKIFLMLFNTAYSFSEKPFNKFKVKLYSHIIDKNFYHITPTNYKQKRIVFTWFYKNFVPKRAHNILTKILYRGEGNFVSSYALNASPSKKQDGLSSYYQFNLKSNPSVILSSSNGKAFNIREIRISSEDFATKEKLKNATLPIKISLSFSNTKDFSNSVEFIKKLKKKTFYRSVNKRPYITIFKSKKTLQYKYIKILILGTSTEAEFLKINEIEILN